MASSARAMARPTEMDARGSMRTGGPGGAARPDLPTLLAFAAMVLLIAANVVAVRVSYRELPPFWSGGARFALAGLLFLGYALARRQPFPRGRALGGVLIYGLLQFGAGFAMGYWALQRVPAGVASVILAAIPLFTILFAFLARLEPLRLRGVIGSLAAVAGIAALFGDGAGGQAPPLYLLAAVGATALFSLAGVVAKKLPHVPPAAMNAVAMLTGAAFTLGLALATGEALVIPRLASTWAAFFYLVLLGSVGLFGLFLFALKRWTVTGLSYQTVLSPFAAVLLSAWLLDEPLTGGLLVGGLLVILGVYIGALAPERRRRAVAAD